jgi:hypothetical protein
MTSPFIECPYCYDSEKYNLHGYKNRVGTWDIPVTCDTCSGIFLIRKVVVIDYRTFKLEVVDEGNPA